MRTGSGYLRSLNDGRQVFVDGERVKDVTAHLAFREAARSIARLKGARKRSLPDAKQTRGRAALRPPYCFHKCENCVATMLS